MDAQMRAYMDDLKARNPLAEVAARYVPRLRKVGGWLMGHCPFHDDRTPSFGVSLQTNTWQCFGQCDSGGDAIDLVGCALFGRAWNSRDPEMLREALTRLDGGLIPPLKEPVPPDWLNPSAWRPIELLPRVQLLLHLAARVYHTTLLLLGQGIETPYAYLRERGWSDATIRCEGIGYATGDLLGPALAISGLTRADAAEFNLLNPDNHHREFMAGRIVFVECDRSGRVLHLIGRKFAPWLGESSPKYLSLKEMRKPLYGYARLDKRESRWPVLVVESPPDAITARQWGFDALATTGTRLKEEHARLLSGLPRPILYLPHNDGGAGWEAAERWQAMASKGLIVPLPDDVKDLNELGTRSDGEARFVAQLKMFGYERRHATVKKAGPPVATTDRAAVPMYGFFS